MKTWLLALAAVASLGGCGGSGDDEGVETTVPFEVLVTAASFSSGVGSQRLAVVRDGAAWGALWKEFNAGATPMPTQPPVDFSNRNVVGVFLGVRASCGYSVSITQITRRSSGLIVRYRERKPGPGNAVCAALTYPAQIVTIPASTDPVEFVGEAPELQPF